MPDNKAAKKEAAAIVQDFWSKFERALEPKHCDKQTYLDALEELVGDAEMRIDAVREELADEGG